MSKGLRWSAVKTDADKWIWHAEVYAARRVVLGIYDRTSPADEDGKWYDEALIDDALYRIYGEALAEKHALCRNE